MLVEGLLQPMRKSKPQDRLHVRSLPESIGKGPFLCDPHLRAVRDVIPTRIYYYFQMLLLLQPQKKKKTSSRQDIKRSE